jgi:hypothetical protein
MNRVLNRRKIQHLIEIHIETYWFQRSLTDLSVVDSFLKTNGILGKVNFVSGSIQILKTIEIEINKTGSRRINGIFVPKSMFMVFAISKL